MKKIDSKNSPVLSRSRLKELLEDFAPLPFTEEMVKQLSQSHQGNHAWDCLRLRWMIEQSNNGVDSALATFPVEKRVKVMLYLSKWLSSTQQFSIALPYAKQSYALAPNNKIVLRRLINLHHQQGDITQRLILLRRLCEIEGKLLKQEMEMAEDEAQLLGGYWHWEREAVPIPHGEAILHVLNKSYPEINGYTVRSMEIVKQQANSGMQPIVLTRLGWPDEPDERVPGCEIIDGISHIRLPNKDIVLNKVPMSKYFKTYAEQFSQVLEEIRPRIVHAASNFQSGMVPLMVSAQRGIPAIYEVRGLWHLTTDAKRPGFAASDRFRLHEQYELLCCRLASRVVVISEGVKQYLAHLGIDEECMHVIPNGVDTDRFTPRQSHFSLQNKLGLIGKTVIGYIGSVESYEGLHNMLVASAKLQQERGDLHIVIVGDGSALPELKQLAGKLGIKDWVTIAGKVPREEILEYYSVIDVFPFPRIPAKVCELVTPLKPFEAMAMGKRVVASDTPAMREIVVNGRTGLMCEAGSSEALFYAIRNILTMPELGEAARQWVVKERDWRTLAARYYDVYEMER